MLTKLAKFLPARRGFAPRLVGVVAVALVVAMGGMVAGRLRVASAAAGSTIVYSLGDDAWGQLGVTPFDGGGDSSTPVAAVGFSTTVAAFATDGRTSAAVHTDGTVWTWGDNEYGMLGDGSSLTQRYAAVQVPGLSNIVQISMSHQHALAVGADGSLWAWGRNVGGELGDGKDETQEFDAPTPVRVAVLSGVTQAAAGGTFSVALNSKGEVYAWGRNGLGQLGDKTFTDSTTPVRTSAPYGITQIVAGENFAVAVRSVSLGGSVWAWGSNSTGQLGVATSTTVSNVAVRAGGQAVVNITQLAAGDSHAMALQTDGSLWAWGNNEGSLGDGTNIDRSTPQKVSGVPGVAKIAAGGNQSVAVAQDGTLWDWGRYLGSPDAVRLRPTQVGGAQDVVRIAVGGNDVLLAMPSQPASVPDLIGRSYTAAAVQSKLQTLGLTLGAVSTQADSSTCANIGRIVSEGAPAGTMVPFGSAVSIGYIVAPSSGCAPPMQNCPSDPADSGGVTWAVDAVHPVFYGVRDLTAATNGVPQNMMVYYPSVDGTPSSARMLKLCDTRWPVVLFLHGQPPMGVPTAGYHRRWRMQPSELARSGYVVVVPNWDAQLTTVDNGPAMVEAVMNDVAWVRQSWSEANWVDKHPEKTAVIGHSYGAVLAARVAAAHPEIGAFVSLGGVYDEAADAPTLLSSIKAPSLFLWSTDAWSEDLIGGAKIWDKLTQDKYAGRYVGEHFDYLPPQDSGTAPRGTCAMIPDVSATLATLFISQRVRVGASITYFPVDLSVPQVDLTQQQAFYAGAHLNFAVDQLNTIGGCHMVLARSMNNVTVPNLYGATASAAAATLQAAGLALGTVGSIPTDAQDLDGLVTYQSTAAGTQVPFGTQVNVSLGRYSSTICGPNPC